MLVHCNACVEHEQITGITIILITLMIAPSQIIALTSTWCCVRHLTSNAHIKRKVVLLRAQFMRQQPIDQGLCDIKVSAK